MKSILIFLLAAALIVSARAQQTRFNEVLVKDKIGIGALASITGEFEIDDFFLVSDQITGGLDSNQFFFGDIDAWSTANGAAAHSNTNNFHIFVSGAVSGEIESDAGFSNWKIESGTGFDSWLELQEAATAHWSIGQDSSDGGALHFATGAGMGGSTYFEIEKDGQISIGSARPASDTYLIHAQNSSGSADLLKLYRPTASNGSGSFIDWQMQDSGSNLTVYARLIGRILDNTNGSEDGDLELRLMGGGSMNVEVTFTPLVTTVRSSVDVNPGTLTVTGASTDTTPLILERPIEVAGNAVLTDYILEDSGLTPQVYARTAGVIDVNTATAEDGKFEIRVADAGAINTKLVVHSLGVDITGTLKVNATTMNVPDFVFENPERENIEELACYIETNNHLPEFPSAKDTAAWGSVDLIETDMRLLERLEKLTLHLISQQQRIKALERLTK